MLEYRILRKVLNLSFYFKESGNERKCFSKYFQSIQKQQTKLLHPTDWRNLNSMENYKYDRLQ